MTIINIRGTSGSGKSTLVRRIMELYPHRVTNQVHGRKRAQSYLLSGHGDKLLFVPGHYETACGGCDTLKTVDLVYELVRRAAGELGCHVLYEGIMVMDDVRRAGELRAEGQDLRVVALTTPVADCLLAVGDRRRDRGDIRPLDPKNTVARAERCARGLRRLEALDPPVPVHRLGREEAFEAVRGWLAS